MAVADCTAARTLPAPSMAKPGFGKRSAPDQPPRCRSDFAHLPTREALIAAFIDHLPEGAAIDAKSLAKQLPDYGQQACRSALNALSEAGHLRRLHGTVGEGRTQWVTRTYFSRQARDDTWWTGFAAGNVPVPPPARRAHRQPDERPPLTRAPSPFPEAAPAPEPAPRSEPI
ncbi:MarR family transcriptional regulator, partial [Streptomyces palmae]